jgi:hypothetical protein
MKDAICIPVPDGQGRPSIKRIDENGKAGSQQGNMIVSQIAGRIERQSARFLQSQWSWINDNTRVFLLRSSWLWAATPKNVIEYIERYLTDRGDRYDQTWNHLVESASRCFTNESQFKILCKQIYIRSSRGQGNPFPIQSMRSVARILTCRGNGWRGLDADMARHFSDRAANAICIEVESRNIKQRFFQGVFLILALLRFRTTDPTFFDPENQSNVFKRIESCFRKGIEIAREQNDTAKIQLIQKTIDFMYSKGCKGIIGQVASQAGE